MCCSTNTHTEIQSENRGADHQTSTVPHTETLSAKLSQQRTQWWCLSWGQILTLLQVSRADSNTNRCTNCTRWPQQWASGCSFTVRAGHLRREVSHLKKKKKCFQQRQYPFREDTSGSLLLSPSRWLKPCYRHGAATLHHTSFPANVAAAAAV